MSNEISARQSGSKASYSIVGCLSAVLGVVPICTVIYFYTPLSTDSLHDGLFPVILGLIIASPPLALILGIIALFQKNRKKLFAVIGVSLSALFVLSIVAFVIYFFRVNADLLTMIG
jgi:hypothetical protein